MTPKEKAEELVDKMYFSRRYDDTENYIPQRAYDHAKQCALIAVDEIIKSEPRYPSNVDWDDAGGSFQYYYEAQREEAERYWEEVKKEIENIKGGEQ